MLGGLDLAEVVFSLRDARREDLVSLGYQIWLFSLSMVTVCKILIIISRQLFTL
jgi:hypothetical protein